MGCLPFIQHSTCVLFKIFFEKLKVILNWVDMWRVWGTIDQYSSFSNYCSLNLTCPYIQQSDACSYHSCLEMKRGNLSQIIQILCINCSCGSLFTHLIPCHCVTTSWYKIINISSCHCGIPHTAAIPFICLSIHVLLLPPSSLPCYGSMVLSLCVLSVIISLSGCPRRKPHHHDEHCH